MCFWFRPLRFKISGNWNLFGRMYSFRSCHLIICTRHVWIPDFVRFWFALLWHFNFRVLGRFGIFRAPASWNGLNRKTKEHISWDRSQQSDICAGGSVLYQFTTFIYLAEIVGCVLQKKFSKQRHHIRIWRFCLRHIIRNFLGSHSSKPVPSRFDVSQNLQLFYQKLILPNPWIIVAG